ncbi:MAG: hypothetical protein VX333_00990 [SAR324 cluster bacterium]|nr:hypothetical protein [SAR324 cluster bacterium]
MWNRLDHVDFVKCAMSRATSEAVSENQVRNESFDMPEAGRMRSGEVVDREVVSGSGRSAQKSEKLAYF